MKTRREEQLRCIEHNLAAFTKMVIAKTSKVPSNWEVAEIRQWVMDCAKDAWVSKIPASQMRRYQMAKQVHGLYPWVLPPYKYQSADTLLANLNDVIGPAEAKAKELLERRKQFDLL